MMIHFWSVVTKTKNIASIQAFHSEVGEYIVEIVNNNKNLVK